MAERTPLAVQTAQDGIADVLRAEITRGRIAPGAALRQEELAERFGVSRIPVREALRRLESEHLVTILANRGAFVVRLSAAEITEITDMRVLLEGDLAARTAAAATGADAGRIRQAMLAAERLSGTEQWVETDREFHRQLYLPATRPRQLDAVLKLRAAVEAYEALYHRLAEDRHLWLRQHRDILAAISQRDAEAARSLLASHVRAAGGFLLQHLGNDGPA